MVGLVGNSGRIWMKEQFPTVISEDPEEHIDHCSKILERCLKSAGLKEAMLCGIGVAVPGLADPSRGILVQAPYAGWKNVEIEKMLRLRWPSTVIRIANDVNACAFGESYYTQEPFFRNFLWVTLSTGIGGGLVLNGEIFDGANGIAGEIGHFIVQWENGERCGCGNKGCLEAHASGIALAKMARQVIDQQGDESELAAFFKRKKLEVTAENLAKAAYEPIDSAVEIFQSAGTYIGKAFSYAMNLLNLEAVIVGGGVSQSFDLLEPHINKVIRSSVIGSSNRVAPVLKTQRGYEAALLGAASLVF